MRSHNFLRKTLTGSCVPTILQVLSGLFVAAQVSCGSLEPHGDNSDEIVNPEQTPAPDSREGVPLVRFDSVQKSRIAERFAEKVSPQYQPVFDETLSEDQKTLIQQDLITIAEYKYDVNRLDRFGNIFGDPNQGGMFDYLKQRIKVLVGDKAQGFVGQPEWGASFWDTKSQSPLFLAENSDKKAFMTAQNFGTLLWYNRLIFEKSVYVKGAKESYEVDSMRDGVIMFLDGYRTTVRDENGQQQRISSPATLIHEARHSDCSVALSAEQIEQIRSTEDILKGDLRCGHLHVACPTGHPLEGLNACDSDYWGAYQVSGYYSQMIETACANCNEEELKMAEIARKDSLARVLPLLKDPNEASPQPNFDHFE